MKTNKITKVLTLMMVMITTMSFSALAGSSSKTYYAKATVTAVGKGKVYVGTNSNTPTADQYQTTSEASGSVSSSSTAANKQFFLFAQPDDALTKLEGWYDNPECTGNALSNKNGYEVQVSTNSTDSNNPVEAAFYAKFVEATEFFSSTYTVIVVGEGGTASVSTDPDAETAGLTASYSNTVEPAHTYYLKAQVSDAENYRFLGWYSDETCETRISANANYTHNVTAESTDEANPTQFVVYAKFEKIVEMTCTKDRLYINIGDEPVANDGITCTNTTITSCVSSNTAVATVAEDGKVTPVAAGSAKITVSGDDVEDVTYIVTVLDYTEAGKTQIGNGNFEDWSNVTSSNHAPNNWNSFETNEGQYASMAKAQQVRMVEDHRPGSNGLYCAEIYSRNVVVANAQGNLTLGCINAGSMTAANKANHNFSKIDDESKSETISKIPTALKCWVKFVPNNESYQARVAATVHDKFNYITYGQASDDTDSNKEHVVASAEQNFTACDWTELTLPFTLSGNAVLNDQLYIVVNISTNATPGGGSSNDHLFIDDVELVYENEYDEVPVSVGDAKYSTFVAPFDIKMPAAVKASTVETVGNENENVLDLQAVEGNVVVANTPVILNAEDAQNRIAFGIANPAATLEYGLLTGVYQETSAPVGSYVLQNQTAGVGFYKVETEGIASVEANHAYLTLPTSSEARVLTFGGETAINAIEALTSGKAQIFDLNGRKLNSLQKGINIVNGVKILVK